MALESEKIGLVAAQIMERLEDVYDQDETAEIESVLLIVAVDHSAGEKTAVYSSASPDVAVHVGVGMLEQVKHNLLRD